jgi:hypothetical protein
MAEPIIKYNSQGNLIYQKDSQGNEYWYDNNGNVIHSENLDGYRLWRKCDQYNKYFFYINNEGSVKWKKNPIYVEYNNTITFLM